MPTFSRYTKLQGVPESLLQTFRLAHAIAEAGIPLAVRPSHKERWKWLGRYFPDLEWRATHFGLAIRDIEVDHRTPNTRVGSLERPLIFAQGIVERCSEKWSERIHPASFAGHLTERRLSALAGLQQAFGSAFRLVATDAGRRWPEKAWDDDYYTLLGASAVTVCPDGDFTWTYRFFEAALCGSIPVIQNEATPYLGFRFYRMTDRPTIMRWREEWAHENADRARRLLTVSHQSLRDAVRSVTR